MIAYWTWIVGTGRPAEFAIQTHLLDWHPHWKAIAGLLVSPARGLVFYAPAALFGAGGLIHALWTDFHSRYWQTVPLAAGVICSFYLSTSYQAWISGFSFGPRYLTDIVAVLFYFLPDALPRILKNSILRPLWWFAVAASVLCNATGAYATWNWERIADQSVWNWRAYPPLYVSLGTLVKSRE